MNGKELHPSETGEDMEHNQPSQRGKLIGLVIALCAVLLLAVGTLIAVKHYIGSWSRETELLESKLPLSGYDRILPGVTICGEDVSGLTRDEAALKVRALLLDRGRQALFLLRLPDRDVEIRD